MEFYQGPKTQRDLQRMLKAVKSCFVSMRDAAEIRHVTKAAIHQLIKRGRLKEFDLFGQILLSRTEVEGFEKDTPGPKVARKRKS